MNALKKARTDAELTLRELSEKSGVALETLSRLENDQRKPQVRTLSKIAGALGIPVSRLANEVRVDHMVASAEEAASEGKVVVYVSFVSHIDDVDRRLKLDTQIIRFPGKKVATEQRYGGDETLTLYEVPKGYRVHKKEAHGEADLYPYRRNPDTGEFEYITYPVVEDLLEEYPEFANAVGLYPVIDID